MTTTAAVLSVALLAAVFAVLSAVTVVPPGRVAVVARFGRAVRTKSPGLAVTVPLVDRVTVLQTLPSRVEPLHVSGTTRDGVDVRITASLMWQVVDPARALSASPDPATATMDVVEHAVQAGVGEVDLRDLLADREAAMERVLPRADDATRQFGATVLDVGILDAEVRVGPELLRLLQ
jgi:regulator of protease activity HflC (stomatin/prohibitin superfamily)